MAGKIDYVAGWYYKAASLMQKTKIRTAFVSTNSITQGEQVAAVWEILYSLFDVHIDFGYRTFVWSNEAKGMAAVHCVIVGFSVVPSQTDRIIFDSDGTSIVAKNISPYLVDAPLAFIDSRSKPLCDVPEMTTGNRPADGGHLIIENKDLDAFVKADPLSEKYIKRFVIHHPRRNALPVRHSHLQRAQRMDAGGGRAAEKRLSLFKGYRLQQLSLA